MQYWFWWGLKYDLKETVELKFPHEGQVISASKLESLLFLDIPLGGGAKTHLIKGLYVLKDLIEKPEAKAALTYQEKRFKKNTQLGVRALFSEKQVCFYFQVLYTKIFDLYNLRKLKLSIFEKEKGLMFFILRDMIGVTKSYDLFKWSYQIKVNVQLTGGVLKESQGFVFNSYFIVNK